MKRQMLRIENPFLTRPQQLPNSRQRILVAESEADIRRLNAEVLVYSGYDVDTADNGAVAWNALQFNNYDLLITSHDLAQMSGLHLLKKIYEAGTCLPVIMTTNLAFPQEFVRHPWLYNTTLLRLPYTVENFLGMVKDILHQTASIRRGIVPPPNWKSQTTTIDLQLV